MAKLDNKYECGAAHLTVDFRGGVLVAQNGDGVTLLRGKLLRGGWDALVKALLNNTEDAEGPMVPPTRG